MSLYSVLVGGPYLCQKYKFLIGQMFFKSLEYLNIANWAPLRSALTDRHY